MAHELSHLAQHLVYEILSDYEHEDIRFFTDMCKDEPEPFECAAQTVTMQVYGLTYGMLCEEKEE